MRGAAASRAEPDARAGDRSLHDNAFLTFEEAGKGSLEPGKLADFIVLNRGILSCPVEQVKDIKVDATDLGGARVYVRPGEH